MRTLGLAGAFALLAIVHTYPLILHLDAALPGQSLGDNVSFVWNLWWMREALASPSLSFWTSPLLMAPHGAALALHTHTALLAVAGATVLRSIPVVAAMNVLLIASLALNGISAFVLARAVGATFGAAAVAGGLFELSPAITARLMGHYNLVTAWPLLCACAAFVVWWRRSGMMRAALVGLAAAIVPYADYYYAVYFGLFAVAYALVAMISIELDVARRSTNAWVWPAAAAIVAVLVAVTIAVGINDVVVAGVRVSLRTPTNALTAAWVLIAIALLVRWRIDGRVHLDTGRLPPRRDVGVVLGTAGLMLLPLLVPAARIVASDDYVTQSSSLRSGPRGVDVATIVLGPPFSGTGGGTVRAVYRQLGLDVMEASAWIGLVPLVLLIGIAPRLWRDGEGRRWIVIGAVFALWALGASLTVGGVNIGLLLPQALARLLPIVNNARIPGRAIVMVSAVVSILVALAITRRVIPRPFTSAPAVAMMVVMAAVDLIGAPLPLTPLPDPGVYRALSARPDGLAVLPIPFGVRDGFGEDGRFEDEALYAQTIHRHPLVGGFLARIPASTRSWYTTTEPYRTLIALSEGKRTDTGRLEPTPTLDVPAPTLDAGAGFSRPKCATALEGLRAASVGYVVVYSADLSTALRAFVETVLPLERIGADASRVLYRVMPARCGVR